MTKSSGRLWDKGTPLDEVIHRFTVGDDPQWDRHLVHWDCQGSAAHACTLARAGLLSPADLASLLAGLAEIDTLAAAGEFAIPPELEDCHTAIEAHLTRTRGEVGSRIHAGRSRNDQVVTALRLFMRHHALAWLDGLSAFITATLDRAIRDGDVLMPGYTHGRAAMPSSIGLWLHALAEAALEQVRAVLDLLDRLDACPLGTGAGFGVPLPLDRAYTAHLLGFTHVQRSPIDVQNSRGRMERYFARVAADVAGVAEKLASDLLLFSMAEFGFFGLPDELTTGSSLMPQKRNPDVLELLRAQAARAPARVVELELIAGKLPSGYHRDLQLTKEAAIRAALDTQMLLAVATRVVERFTIDRERLAAALRPELWATQAALDLVRTGVPFRTAYRQVADDLSAGRFVVPGSALPPPGGLPSGPQAAPPAGAYYSHGRVPPGVVAEVRSDLAALQRRADAHRSAESAAEEVLLNQAASGPV